MVYDLIIIGGGLAGATLAMSLAKKGAQVLVLEHDPVFRDRLRGEVVQPWGVAEALELGIYELLKETCAREVQYRLNRVVGLPQAPPRDLLATTPQHVGALCFYHPEMQEVLLGAAAHAGALVRRGISLLEVQPGAEPSVRIRDHEREITFRTRLIVGADGRNSASRHSAGFAVRRDPDRMVISGTLLTGLSAPTTSYNVFINPQRGEVAMQVPIGRERSRCYTAFYRQDGRQRLSGVGAAGQFVTASTSAGAPPEWFERARVDGPLASFDCAQTWVDHPYACGITLVGDAAAASDPTFGCGLSLTLRDVRVLRDALLSEEDWDTAAHNYAAEHDRYSDSLHRILNWMTMLLFEPGAETDVRRRRAFARIAEDPRRLPDFSGLGPEAPSSDDAYRNLFGEDPRGPSMQQGLSGVLPA